MLQSWTNKSWTHTTMLSLAAPHRACMSRLGCRMFRLCWVLRLWASQFVKASQPMCLFVCCMTRSNGQSDVHHHLPACTMSSMAPRPYKAFQGLPRPSKGLPRPSMSWCPRTSQGLTRPYNGHAEPHEQLRDHLWQFDVHICGSDRATSEKVSGSATHTCCSGSAVFFFGVGSDM